MLWKRRRLKRRGISLEQLEDRRVLDSTVVFNELFYHPSVAESQTEWIELHNQMAVNMDVSGWTVEGVDYQFPARTTIPGGGYVVIAKDPTRMVGVQQDSLLLGPYEGQMSNAGERLVLRNISNRAMDTIDFDDEGVWPAAADGSGASLAKIEAQAGSGAAANWTSSGFVGGTPGAENFPEFDPTPTSTVIAAGDAIWRVNDAGQSLPANWVALEYGDEEWTTGESPLYAGEFPSINRPGGNSIDGDAQSIVIQNPSFEANVHGDVGYGEIDGWTHLGRVGINPTTTQSRPFADNGQIPDQKQVGFIQKRGSLSQVLEGFTLDQEYWLELHYNARDCCGANPILSVSYAGSLLMAPTPVEPVGGVSEFQVARVRFTPTAESGQLLIRNLASTGDNTLLLDAISIIPRDEEQVLLFNSSFEASGAIDLPLNGNQIAGWTHTGFGTLGVSTMLSPLHDNGTIPDGQAAVYLTGPGTLSQSVDGLIPGDRYEIRLQVNASLSGSRPKVVVALNGRPVVLETVIEPVGQSGAYHLITQAFTASAESVQLAIQQTDQDGTGTLFVDNVMLRHEVSPLATEVNGDTNTHYFRREFDFSGNPAETDLAISHFLDDGAIVYLNGVEVLRHNLAAGVVDFSSLAEASVGDPSWSEPQVISSTPLQKGKNLLAVEVHQALTADPDMAFGLELVADEYPVNPDAHSWPVRINELSGSDAETGLIELFHLGDSPVALNELLLTVGEQPIPLPDQLLPPQGIQVISIPTSLPKGDLVSLVHAGAGLVLDAVHIGESARGRMPDGEGAFLNEVTSSFNAKNQIQLADSIVINEVMYHQIPEFSRTGIPPTFELDPIIEFDSEWRYYDTGDVLPENWFVDAHPVGGSWKQGPGLLGFETGQVIDPGLGTELHDDDFLAYYFEKEFEVTAEMFDQSDRFQIRHVIDDGAVFYLNGEEFLRFNLDKGPIEPGTKASGAVNNAKASPVVTIPRELLSVGENRLSVQLRQRAQTSSDAIFGLELTAASIVEPGVPATPFQENNEEWVELYNRSLQPVDLSGWSLDDAVEFEFPEGTIIPADNYLVVAKAPVRLAEQYPAANIIGPFEGRLNNGDERIVLRDSLNNRLDQVHYYDGGRWPSAADGGGASLELESPFADNSIAEAWSASVPNPDSQWKSYSIRMTGANPEGLSSPVAFHELVLGLLDEGEVLLDNIQLTEDPAKDAVQLMQNGDFEQDSIGEAPAHWRWVGNHNRTQVIVDPKDQSNQVMQIVADGPTEHMSNHGESTFANGVRVSSSKEYELSFDALWVNGSPQLNSRLYFARGGATTVLETNSRQGTPGEKNSTWVNNAGPLYSDLRHQPVVPQADEPVVVSIHAVDADGIGDMTLHYAVRRGEFQSVSMEINADGRFQATIPGQAKGATVQFYVTGTDQRGVQTQFPAEGAASRALYKVDDPLDNGTGHGLRILMNRNDVSTLHRADNVMSNGRLGATVIYNDEEVFYDVGVRLRASGYGRRGQLAGFNVQFDPQKKFRDVHQTIALDRGAVFSNGNGGGVRGQPGASAHELLIYQVINHAGGIAGMYDDVVYVDAPRSGNTGLALLKMARYSSDFVDTFFEDGGDGSLYKYELIYHTNSTVDGNPESVKQAPNAVMGTDISDLGDDKEAYRHNFILKNNRARDDYDGIMELGKAFSKRGESLDEATQEIMDMDAWMRTFALQSLVGTADTYNMGLAHNLELFVRPDGKVVPLPWDVDHGFYYSTNGSLLGRGGSNLARVIKLPHNKRLFYKHLLDLVQTTYNTEYLTAWAQHYEEMTQHKDVGDFFVDYVKDRSEFVLSRLDRDAPRIPFAITADPNGPLQVNDLVVALEGTGWIDVHAIRLKGSEEIAEVAWLDDERWQITFPLLPGENQIELEAFNYQGEKVGADQVVVVSNAERSPLFDHLRLVEVMYHPAEPTADELAVNPDWQQDDFEFVEFLNTSDSITLDLTGVRFTDGPAETYDLGAKQPALQPGQRVVVVSNAEAFASRYPGVSFVGEFAGNLRNSGERLRIEDQQGTALIDFVYSDDAPWPEEADGAGASLELVDPVSNAAADLSKAEVWKASAPMGGSPGARGELVGDVTQDGKVDLADIDFLCTAASDDLSSDLNRDGLVNLADLTFLVEDVLKTGFGDANLDGVFDSSDLVMVFQAGQYEDQVAGNSTWATGDWNCDREFTTSDLVVAMQGGSFVSAAQPAILPGPLSLHEPTTGHHRLTSRDHTDEDLDRYAGARPSDLMLEARDRLFDEWSNGSQDLRIKLDSLSLADDEFDTI
ncbi:MAG: hypothetical protein GY768_17565 [Planctomycetaceae bacterium]|nr:hypothetical protein [Planctomycetaceae bacterium]